MADQATSLPVRSEADIDERLQSKIVDFTTPSQGMAVDSDNDAHVKAKLRDDSGNAFGTALNPVTVNITNSSSGDGIVDYDTASAIAKDATSTHTYTVTALKTFQGLKIWASASGKMKIEVKFGPAASEVTKYVGFNSISDPNICIDIQAELEVAAGDNVLIIRTNLDNQAQDLYSTIQGTEV